MIFLLKDDPQETIADIIRYCNTSIITLDKMENIWITQFAKEFGLSKGEAIKVLARAGLCHEMTARTMASFQKGEK